LPEVRHPWHTKHWDFRPPGGRPIGTGVAPASGVGARTPPRGSACALATEDQMLELLKFASPKGQSTQEQTGALHLLVTRAEQERTALQAVLDLLAQRDGQVLTLARQVQDAADKMTSLTARLDGLGERISELDGHASDIEALDGRLDTLTDVARGAERQVQEALGAGSELQKQRHTLEQVSEQATKLQTFAEAVEQRIYALETLSDQVLQKTKALEHQQQIVEHAVVQSNRVSEM